MAALQANVPQHPQPPTQPQLNQHDRPLAESIAIATRSVHAKLNKLIIARLPLALPPVAVDSSSYITGLLHITPIYITFETLWRDIIESGSPVDCGNNVDNCCPKSMSTRSTNTSFSASDARELSSCTTMPALLQQLYLPGLMRSDRLKADIANLTGWSSSTVEEQIRLVEQNDRLGDFLQHIKISIQNRPHVLLAYSYILFMALFAGGRFIRATLESAGDEFWDRLPSPVLPSFVPCEKSTRRTKRASGLSNEQIPQDDFRHHATHTMPLRFFHFQTPEDGEDLKREFKRRLASIERELSVREKEDIVQESLCIFNNMTLLVQQLDKLCDDPSREGCESSASSLLNLVDQFHPFRSRLRDSVSIAKDRIQRSPKLSSNRTNLVRSIWKYGAASSPVEPESGIKMPIDHPSLSKDDASSIELCPAFSKSMRFDKTLPRPTRYPGKLTEEHDLNEYFQVASKKLNSVSFVNC
ncbi:hypothetical protein ACLX1H_010011 [Fusarium chlamydosporum]